MRSTAMTVTGLTGRPVTITARRSSGQPALIAADNAGHYLSETRDRIRAGLINAGLALPLGRVSLQVLDGEPTDIPASTELAVAAAILTLNGTIPAAVLDTVATIGEVGLDGAIRPVRGVLVMARAAAEHGIRTVVVPAGNAREAALTPGVRVVAVGTLAEFVAWATTGRIPAPPDDAPSVCTPAGPAIGDLRHVPAAMTFARYAVEVAGAGGHRLHLAGPVGSATLLLARSLPSLLPDLDDSAAAEVSALASVAGQPPTDALIRRPPVQEPHCSISTAALVGGRRPGAISLAHRGVLLLADAPDFDARAVAALRQPLDAGSVTVARARSVLTYPARFQLVLTSRPCPCTFLDCACTAPARRRYQARLAGLGARTAINLHLTPPGTDTLAAGESSRQAAARVARARTAAADRLAASGCQVNAELPLGALTGRHRLPRPTVAALTRMVDAGAITLTGFASILRVAWTISDLRGTERPDQDAIDTATALYQRPTP